MRSSTPIHNKGKKKRNPPTSVTDGGKEAVIEPFINRLVGRYTIGDVKDADGNALEVQPEITEEATEETAEQITERVRYFQPRAMPPQIKIGTLSKSVSVPKGRKLKA